MNKEIVNLALKFLERVQLNGAEVPAFNAVVKELLAAKNGAGEQPAENAEHPDAAG